MSYDLLDSKISPFKVQFSHDKPRPHFMIHPKRKDGVRYENDNVPPEDWKKLALAATSMVEKHNLEGDTTLTLSIHTDDFTTNKEEVHAHLCVEKTIYLEVFRRKRNEIRNKWPNDKLNIDEYKKKVDRWRLPSNSEDVEVIDEVIAKIPEIDDPENVEKLRITAKKKLREKGVHVFHHTEHPKIGFFIKGPQQIELAQATPDNDKEARPWFDISKHIKIFMDYKDEYLKIYPKPSGDKRGYHLCLSPCSKGYFTHVDHSWHSKWNGKIKTENLVLVAYILTSGYHFYQICPTQDDQRKAWLDTFKGSIFEIKT